MGFLHQSLHGKWRIFRHFGCVGETIIAFDRGGKRQSVAPYSEIFSPNGKCKTAPDVSGAA
jgi:hypothetical protein